MVSDPAARPSRISLRWLGAPSATLSRVEKPDVERRCSNDELPPRSHPHPVGVVKSRATLAPATRFPQSYFHVPAPARDTVVSVAMLATLRSSRSCPA